MTEDNQSQEKLEEKAKEEFEGCPKNQAGDYLTGCMEFGIACKEKTEDTVMIEDKEYAKCPVWYKGNKFF